VAKKTSKKKSKKKTSKKKAPGLKQADPAPTPDPLSTGVEDAEKVDPSLPDDVPPPVVETQTASVSAEVVVITPEENPVPAPEPEPEPVRDMRRIFWGSRDEENIVEVEVVGTSRTIQGDLNLHVLFPGETEVKVVAKKKQL